MLSFHFLFLSSDMMSPCTCASSNKEEREEGGTPDIMGSIRLGLAMQMKELLGRDGISVRV